MKPVSTIAASLISALLFTAAGAAVAATPTAKPKPDLAKGKAIVNSVCIACHNADGNSVIAGYPVVAQQHPEYMIKQLKEFKSNARKGTVMNGYAAALSDQDMVDVSYYFASQKANKLAATNQESLALGEKIWRGGIASRAVPACAACHAPNGAGMPIKYPRLAGQKADYTALQLKDFRDGVRKNDLVMPHVVNGMNDAQIKAVADYIQGLR